MQSLMGKFLSLAPPLISSQIRHCFPHLRSSRSLPHLPRRAPCRSTTRWTPTTHHLVAHPPRSRLPAAPPGALPIFPVSCPCSSQHAAQDDAVVTDANLSSRLEHTLLRHAATPARESPASRPTRSPCWSSRQRLTRSPASRSAAP
jgi:hypothetical protein